MGPRNEKPTRLEGLKNMAKKNVEIKWLGDAREQDYLASKVYLTLIYDKSTAKAHVRELKRAPISEFKGKDVFRASGLSRLGISDSHVEKDKQKVESGEELAPLLLVRDPSNSKVIIADGYHRLCAVYSYDEDALIPCKIV